MLELIQWFLDIYTGFYHAQSASHYSTRNMHIIKSVASLTNIPAVLTVLLQFINPFLFWVANIWEGLQCLYHYILLIIPFLHLHLHCCNFLQLTSPFYTIIKTLMFTQLTKLYFTLFISLCILFLWHFKITKLKLAMYNIGADNYTHFLLCSRDLLHVKVIRKF